MIQVFFKSLKDVLYRIDIDNGASGSVELRGSVQPFYTEVNNSTEFFFPVREQSGNIGIVGEVSDVESMLASCPADRPFTVYAIKTVGGLTSQNVVWKGYLQTEAFSQRWDKGPNEISIPVISHLGIIGSYNLETIGYVSFADFIDRMSKLTTQTSIYDSFIFPAITNLTTVLRYRFCAERFASYNSDEKSWSYGDYREILEEFCKVFGWVAVEFAGSLCFIAPDSNAGYQELTAAQLHTLAGDTSVSPTAISQATITDAIAGADHNIDYLPGKKSIKVVGDYAPWDMELFRLNTRRMTKSNNDNYNTYIDSDREKYLYMYSKQYQSDAEIEVLNNNTNIRLENFKAGSDTANWGSSVVCSREYLIDSTADNPLERDSGWMEHIVYKVPYESSPKTVATIKCRMPHIKTDLFSDMVIIIKADIKCSASYKDEWESFDGLIRMKVEVGSNTLYDDYVQVKSGRITATSVWGLANAADGVGVYGNMYSGQIKVSFVAQQVIYYDKYYSISNLSISYIKPWTRHLDEAASQNEATQTISNGWTDSIEQTNKFTTMRPEQIGYGIILDASLTPVNSLYNNTTPEEALCNRMYAHYQTSKKLITAQLESGAGGMLNPLHRHIPGSGSGLVCLSQSVDWRNEQVTALLFEI